MFKIDKERVIVEDLNYPGYDDTADIEVINENFRKLKEKNESQDNEINGKEPAFEKKSGFNLEKTDLVEDDSNKVITPKGVLNLKNWLVEAYTNAINTTKSALESLIGNKLNHGGYGGTGQDLKNLVATAQNTANSAVSKADAAQKTANSKLDKNYCPYAVGQILQTKNIANPATLYPGTTWGKIEGRFLLGTSGSEGAGGTGGASSVKLSVAHIPSHNHPFSATTNTTGNHYHQGGNHRHRVDNHSHTQPAHNHSLNTREGGTGGGGIVASDLQYRSSHGSTWTVNNSAGGETTGGSAPYTDYQNPNTSTTGNHSHTVSGTTGSTGSTSAFSILPPFYKVHMWVRTA